MCECWQAELIDRVELLRKEHPSIYFETNWHAETGWNFWLLDCSHGIRRGLCSGQNADAETAAEPVLNFLRALEKNDTSSTA